MTQPRELSLPADPEAALSALREASADAHVVVFKKSPICPTSTRAEFEFKQWLGDLDDADPVRIAWVDVIAERPLARGLTSALDVEHQSPQALWFTGGDLAWHDSHGALTCARFTDANGG